MTLKELCNKTVNIKMDVKIPLKDDLNIELLECYIEDQKDQGFSDKELLEKIVNDYYSTNTDLEDIIDFNDYKISIK